MWENSSQVAYIWTGGCRFDSTVTDTLIFTLTTGLWFNNLPLPQSVFIFVSTTYKLEIANSWMVIPNLSICSNTIKDWRNGLGLQFFSGLSFRFESILTLECTVDPFVSACDVKSHCVDPSYLVRSGAWGGLTRSKIPIHFACDALTPLYKSHSGHVLKKQDRFLAPSCGRAAFTILIDTSQLWPPTPWN